jgi:shikimate kinase
VASARSPQRIVLVGFMGSGKSTVGAALARRLGWGFRDLDRWIEERHGLTVAELFRRHGEAYFREEERRAARAAARLRRHVVAAGGGAFAAESTRAVLQAGALTVWLRCAETALWRRLPHDGSRPLAADRGTMRRLVAEREPSYRLADLAIDTSRAAPEEVARRIVEAAFTRKPAQARRTAKGR